MTITQSKLQNHVFPLMESHCLLSSSCPPAWHFFFQRSRKDKRRMTFNMGSVWNSKASMFLPLEPYYPPGRALMSARWTSADGCELVQAPIDWYMPILGLVCPPDWLLGADAPTPWYPPAPLIHHQSIPMRSLAQQMDASWWLPNQLRKISPLA